MIKLMLKLHDEKKNLVLRDHVLPVGKRTCIMGILNVTPDSFSDGGRFTDVDMAVEHAVRMQDEGADIIDIGGESSRPGSGKISLDEELSRVMPVISKLKGILKVPLSIDTCKSTVAEQALSEGVSIVNDITALSGDEKMAGVIADSGAGVILMHMNGDPLTMQAAPEYRDLIGEILYYLSGAVQKAERSGISPEAIIVDPGIGFGKTLEHNLAIIKDMHLFRRLGKPVMAGVSRKSFLGKITGKDADSRSYGSAAAFTAAIMNGADIIRVHDVDKMRDVALIAEAVTCV